MIHFLPFHICQLLNSLPLMYMKPDPFQAEIRPTGHYMESPRSPLPASKLSGALWQWGGKRKESLKPFSSTDASCVVGGWGERKRQYAGHLIPLPIIPLHAFYFSDYCYFFRNTQRELLQRREACNYVSGI